MFLSVRPNRFQFSRRFLVLIPATVVIAAMLACSINLQSTPDPSIGLTQTALVMQQASMALQATQMAATQAAQNNNQTVSIAQPEASATPNLAETMAALAVAQTIAAMPQQPAVETQVIAQPPAQPPAQPVVPPPAQPQPPSEQDFKAWMQSAKILVYEDIVVDQSETQYVKKTLENMGLKRNFKWVGNAQGHFKSDILGGTWDLVIIAAETRSDISGEYFDYVSDVLNQGIPVVMEAWHLDAISQGAISPILAKCGVQVSQYVPKAFTTLDVLIYPISPVSSPILLEPNSGLSFTKARDKWISTGDLGSKMALTGRGDAQLLLGTKANEYSQSGTLASCMEGQLTLMTFSSHSFSLDTMYPLWENMIYQALKYRFTHGS